MVRLKFFAFALVVLSIWWAHLKLISPLGERAVEMARPRGLAAPVSLDNRVWQRRAEVQRVLLKAVGTPARGSRDATASERLAAIRADLKDSIPEDLKGQLIIGVAGDSTVFLSPGEDGDRTQGLNLPAIAEQAGAEGSIQDLGGVQYVFYSAPAGPNRLVVGAPLLPEKAADAIAAELDLAAVAILQKGKVVAVGGLEKATAELLAKNTRAEKPEYVKRGNAGSFGPFRLPLFAGGEDGAPLLIAARHPTKAPATEIVSVVSLRPFMAAVADYQNLALWILGGLLALSALVGLIIRPTKEHEARAEEPEEEAGEPASPPPLYSFSAAPPEPPLAEAEPAAQAGEPTLGSSNPPPVPTGPQNGELGRQNGELEPPGSESEQPTRVYPALSPDREPAPEPMRYGEGTFSSAPDGEGNPDATRLAPVPEELIRASAQPQNEAEGGVDEENRHFYEVYREFLTARKKCGELADGLSYEKFASKLRKNRDQLVEKYACRTVRFQVYVKEGKAALKATPIRD